MFLGWFVTYFCMYHSFALVPCNDIVNIRVVLCGCCVTLVVVQSNPGWYLPSSRKGAGHWHVAITSTHANNHNQSSTINTLAVANVKRNLKFIFNSGGICLARYLLLSTR